MALALRKRIQSTAVSLCVQNRANTYEAEHLPRTGIIANIDPPLCQYKHSFEDSKFSGPQRSLDKTLQQKNNF
jgi:hypothetical protein